MLTQKPGSASSSATSEDQPSIDSEKIQAEDLLAPEAQETQAEPEITSKQLSIGKRLLNWRTLVPLVIVIAALVYFAQKANIDPQKTWAAIRTANPLFFLAAFLAYYVSFPLRALRWRLLLENVGYNKKNGVHLPGFWKLLEIIYIAWFANAVVPAKLGEIYRAYLIRQEADVSATRSFGTILAERMLDLIVLLLMFIPSLIISLHENLPPELRAGLYLTLAAVIIGVAALIALRIFRMQIARFVPKRLLGHYHHLQEGTLGSFRRIPTLTVLTIAVWSCEALRFFFIALALNLITGNLLHVVAAALFIALGEALLTVVPFTSGGIGLVEAGMLAMIALFTAGTPTGNSVSAAAILLDRTISLFSILLFGFIVFLFASWRRAVKQEQVRSKAIKQTEVEEPVKA